MILTSASFHSLKSMNLAYARFYTFECQRGKSMNLTRRAWPLPFWFSLRPRPVLTWQKIVMNGIRAPVPGYPDPDPDILPQDMLNQDSCPRISWWLPSAKLPLLAMLLHLSRLRASLLLLKLFRSLPSWEEEAPTSLDEPPRSLEEPPRSLETAPLGDGEHSPFLTLSGETTLRLCNKVRIIFLKNNFQPNQNF